MQPLRVTSCTELGPGRTQFTTGWELERAVKALLAERGATGLLTVTWERQETVRERYVGPGRGGPNRRKATERVVRYQITSVARDGAAIEKAIAPYRKREGLTWKKSEPSLEDVFIDLMGRAKDNFQ